MREDRQGFVNDSGNRGALKRDELNTVGNRDAFVQATWDVAPQWTLIGGARHSTVRFDSHDRFIRPGNPDDSGSVTYIATNPVAGIAWHASRSINLYANVGRGFETPTFTELAYRPASTGLNTDLLAARSRHAEIGLKAKLGAAQRFEAAVFDIATREEIVVETNDGGRSTFRNAGRTTRRGIELSYVAEPTDALRVTLAATRLDARFADAFASGSGPSAMTVAAGNRLPGVPERSAFGELSWRPARAWGGFNAAIEAVHTGRLFVDDANSDAAPAATVFNLRVGWAQRIDEWAISELVRVDNLTGRSYAGSVIVNEASRRFFEPALPRTWQVGVKVGRVFD